MTQEIRRRAVFEFGKFGRMPEDQSFFVNAAAAGMSIASVQEAYKPRRQFKAPMSQTAAEQTRVHSTLLEYGRRHGLSRLPKKDAIKSDIAKAFDGGHDDEVDAAVREEKRIKALLKGMSQAGEGGSISAAALGSLVGFESQRIAELSGEYVAQQAMLHEADAGKMGGLAAHRRAAQSLQKQIESKKKKMEITSTQHAASQATYTEAHEAHIKAVAYGRRIDKEMAKLDALEGDEANQAILQRLRALITLNESLKSQEEQFRACCKQEMQALQDKISALQGQGVEVLNAESLGARAVLDKLTMEKRRLQKVRMLAARRNREIATLQRKIDEIPSRLELTQYQKRFVELYEQVAAKHRETKRYYTMYNTLDDKKLYIAKEEALLTSIHDNFEKAMASLCT